jgi:hypothetical protein
MKLKYKISKTTSLSSEDIINKILLLIDEKKYGLVNVTDSQVSFDDKRRLIVGNWEYARRLHSGTFEIINNKNTNIVVLEYLPIPLFEFIWVGILVLAFNIFSISNGENFIGLFTLLFIGQLIFKHYNLKNKAEEMLSVVCI